MNKTKNYIVEIDLYVEDYGVVETLDCVGKFDTFKDALNFASEFAKDKTHFRRKWLKQYKADGIELTIRHIVEFDEEGNAIDWDDEDSVIVNI